MLRAVRVMWARQWLSSDDISNHKKCRKNFNYKFTSQTSFAAHAFSRLFSGRVDQTRESGGNRAYVCDRWQIVDRRVNKALYVLCEACYQRWAMQVMQWCFFKGWTETSCCWCPDTDAWLSGSAVGVLQTLVFLQMLKISIYASSFVESHSHRKLLQRRLWLGLN